MKLQYFGTGAGYGIPEIFCSCRICENARAKGGKEIRTRSQAILDDALCIDFSVDTFLHSAFYGMDLRNIHHILITHAHHDHFLTADILSRPLWGKEPVCFYASEKSGEGFKKAIEAKEQAYRESKKAPATDFKAEMHFLKAFQSQRINGYRITPLPARHAAGLEPFLYIIEKENKAILWCHDTGPLPEETKDYLKSCGLQFDFVSLDCTLKRGGSITKSHMDLEKCAETADFLRAAGLLKEGATLALSHISHLVQRTHQELEQEAAEFKMTVAFDGRSFEF